MSNLPRENYEGASANPHFQVNRRRFLQTTSASLSVSALGAFGADLANEKPKRVGLIGTGWYGKSDLWRLIQVAPVEVISLCDVDKEMLAGAVEIASQRQKSKKAPRTYSDYREMLKEKDLESCSSARPIIGIRLQLLQQWKQERMFICKSP